MSDISGIKLEQELYFEEQYLPFIIKRGKTYAWLSMFLIFIPALFLIVFKGASVNLEGVITGIISLVSAMLAWYIVDPITMYPILHIPGMYLTYLAGNSKPIRGPAAQAALNSAGVESGTKEGTIITAIAISVSIFISVGVMTLVAIGGQVIIDILPSPIVASLNYLLPSLFGAMAMQRVMLDYRTSAIVLPLILVLRVMNVNGLFKVLPLGGGYAQVLFAVIIGVIVSKKINKHKYAK